MSKQNLSCDILVIGSGPGGAVTATLLAEAGRDVLLVEEGRHLPAGKVGSYSLAEMDLKYRHGGLAVSMGKEKISYVEGCCVGGASEINAGLYNRPSEQTLKDWAVEYRVNDFSPQSLEPYFAANEQQMSIATFPGDLPAASRIIRAAAQGLGWQAMEIPRMWHYGSNTRQSMSEVFIPRFLNAGGRLRPQVRVKRLNWWGKTAKEAIGHRIRIKFNHAFVCGGAVQTPVLLRRSGVRRNVGNSLSMHPAVRVVARFENNINDPNEGVPVYQVTQFKPHITIGGSYSGRPHLALWLAGRKDFAKYIDEYRRLAIFYTLIKASAKGTVRAIPMLDEPWVNLPMGPADWDLLKQGLTHLEEMLKEAKAVEMFMPDRLDLSTIHLFSSCPMGEDITRCAVDSYGRVHGFDNLYINDASMLPSPPGVNPQATIMAIARRNAEHFLNQT